MIGNGICRNLITGAAGFLGSHLVDRLMISGEKVICLDNYLTGREDNLSKWSHSSNFQLIHHDVTKPINCDVDRIWHLACPASPTHYQSNPIQTSRTIFLGTYNMLELARKLKARILFASSSEIYGDPEVHPQSESYRGSVNTSGIRSCYEEGKRIAETLCSDYQRMYDTEVRLMRIFNTYGPRMLPNDGRVISNFIVQGLNGRPLTIYGNGKQTRSFCYVDDLIDGMILLMNGDYSYPMNFGNPQEFTICELACLIRDLINPKLDLIYEPLPSDDPLRRKPLISLAKEQLNWIPRVSLEKGLLSTIDWFRDFLEECPYQSD